MKKGYLGILIIFGIILIIAKMINLNDYKFHPDFGTYSGELQVIGEEEGTTAIEDLLISFNSGQYSLMIEDELVARGKYRLINNKVKLINQTDDLSELSHVFDGSFKTIETGTIFVLERSLGEMVYRLQFQKADNNEEI